MLPSFGFECTRRMLYQQRLVLTNFEVYIFIIISLILVHIFVSFFMPVTLTELFHGTCKLFLSINYLLIQNTNNEKMISCIKSALFKAFTIQNNFSIASHMKPCAFVIPHLYQQYPFT